MRDYACALILKWERGMGRNCKPQSCFIKHIFNIMKCELSFSDIPFFLILRMDYFKNTGSTHNKTNEYMDFIKV
jgi:hypothetical protein